MGDSDRLVRMAEAGRMLGGLSSDSARRYFDQGLLVGIVTGGGERRATVASVEALARVLRMPPGDDREAAMAELRQSNRAG